jgi:hypothetical protein
MQPRGTSGGLEWLCDRIARNLNAWSDDNDESGFNDNHEAPGRYFPAEASKFNYSVADVPADRLMPGQVA